MYRSVIIRHRWRIFLCYTLYTMKFSKHIFPNGLRLITAPMADNPTVTVLVLVETGSKYETKNINGLSHFLEHMCFKGTTARPRAIDISHELDAIGSAYNAFTGFEYTGYYAKAKAEHFDTLLSVVSDIYLNPTFAADQIEREKGVIIEEINMYEDLPQRTVQSMFMQALHGDQPAGWDIAGPREVVKAMNRNNFVNYRAEHYVASATTVVVAGNITEAAVRAAVEKVFAGVSTTQKKDKMPTVEAQKVPFVLTKEKKTDQTHLVLGFRTVPAKHEDQSVLDVIQGVLSGGMSSRLFQKLREDMGVCYYAKAGNDALTDHGHMEIRTGVDTARRDEVISILLKECATLVTTPVSPEELKKVKDHMNGMLYLGLESSDSIAELYGIQEVLRLPVQTPDEMAAKVQAVTAEDIQRVAKKYFVPEHLNLAIIGPNVDAAHYTKLLEEYGKLV